MSLWKKKGSDGNKIEEFLKELKNANAEYKSKKKIFSQFSDLWNEESNYQFSQSEKAFEDLKEKSKALVADFEEIYLSYEKISQIVEKDTPFIIQNELINAFSKEGKESLDDLPLNEIKQLCAKLENSRISNKKSFEADVDRILGLLSEFVTFFGGKRAGIE